MTQTAFRTLNSVVVPLVRAGLGSPLPVGAGVVVLETTGRRTKKPRQVPLVATRLGDRITVSTVRRDSQWVRNLEHDANGAVWVGGTRRAVVATSIDRGTLTTVSLRPASTS